MCVPNAAGAEDASSVAPRVWPEALGDHSSGGGGGRGEQDGGLGAAERRQFLELFLLNFIFDFRFVTFPFRISKFNDSL